MKVLYLTDSFPEHLADQPYYDLYQLLGPERASKAALSALVARAKLPPAVLTFSPPFSIIHEAILLTGEGDRDIDLFFAARLSNGQRARAWAIREHLEGVRLAGGHFSRDDDRIHLLGHDGYYRILGRVKIGIFVRGGGFDTLRYWEGVACRALLLSDSPDIIIANNFPHQHHAVFSRRESYFLELSNRWAA